MVLSETIPIIIAVFSALLCFFIAFILSIRSKKTRLLGEDKDFIDIFIEAKKISLNKNIDGLTWNKYVILLIISPIVLGALSFLIISPKPLCLLFIVLGLFVPEIVIRTNKKRRKKKFEEKFAMALRTLASSLRSGRSLEQAIDDVAKNKFIDEEIRRGFIQISADIKVGVSIEKAFHRFAEDTQSVDAKDVASAISLQSKVGGNDALLISTISQNIRERIMVRKEIKTIFAETDVLIVAMDILPWLIVGILYIAAPQYISPFFESTSMMIIFVLIMLFTTVGSLVIRKMVKTAKEG